MSTNLETVARGLFADIIGDLEYGRVKTGLMADHNAPINIDDIRDAIAERADQAADDACIYFSHCSEIIDRYENDKRADIESADDIGTTYKPSEYLNAMRDFAFGIARSIIAAEAYELADELESALDEICSAVFAKTEIRHITVADIRLSADCVHGWAAHNFENDAGVCFWLSQQLDGCNAVAMPAAGVWLSYTWEPTAEHCPAVCPIN
jgi:hypothetical protein